MPEYRRMSDGAVVDEAGELNKDALDAKLDREKERENDRENEREKEHDKERAIREVRATDIEPYTGLRYLSKLFRFMAIILLLLLVAEIVTGVYTQGAGSVPTLLGEASRLIVLAGVLWGTGDLAHLMIDVGHDVRAARILMARAVHAGRVGPGGPGRSDIERTSMETTRIERSGDRILGERVASSRAPLADQPHDEDHGPPIP